MPLATPRPTILDDLEQDPPTIDPNYPLHQSDPITVSPPTSFRSRQPARSQSRVLSFSCEDEQESYELLVEQKKQTEEFRKKKKSQKTKLNTTVSSSRSLKLADPAFSLFRGDVNVPPPDPTSSMNRTSTYYQSSVGQYSKESLEQLRTTTSLFTALSQSEEVDLVGQGDQTTTTSQTHSGPKSGKRVSFSTNCLSPPISADNDGDHDNDNDNDDNLSCNKSPPRVSTIPSAKEIETIKQGRLWKRRHTASEDFIPLHSSSPAPASLPLRRAVDAVVIDASDDDEEDGLPRGQVREDENDVEEELSIFEDHLMGPHLSFGDPGKEGDSQHKKALRDVSLKKEDNNDDDEEESNGSDDEDVRRWENEQIRKATSSSSSSFAASSNPALHHSNEIQKKSWTSYFSQITSRPVQSIADIKLKIDSSLSMLHQTDRERAGRSSRLETEMADLESGSVQLKSQIHDFEEQFLFFQKIHIYLRKLVSCLERKAPFIFEKSDQAQEILNQLFALAQEQKEKHADQGEDAKPKESNEDELYDPLMAGSDQPLAEESPQRDTERPKQKSVLLAELQQIRDQLASLFDDESGNRVPSLNGLIREMDEWKNDYPQSFKDAFVLHSLAELCSPFIELEIATWNPASDDDPSFTMMNWFRSLEDHRKSSFSTISSVDLSADFQQFFSKIFQHILLPKFSKTIQFCFDPFDSAQSDKLRSEIAEMNALSALQPEVLIQVRQALSFPD